MPIKFNCPHCKRGLSVKDHLAGKRAACPACKQPISIPAATAAAAPSAIPEDLEALAAAALGDESKPAAPVKEDTRSIEFTCPQCDAVVKVGIALAGKNAPCPECRRIVKVPLPAQEGPKDWRKVDPRVPSGAKREELEGAWGSTTSAGAVSREALFEAEAIPEAVEKTSFRKWIIRGAGVTAVLCLVAGGVLLALNLRTRGQEEKGLTKALEAVADAKTPEQLWGAAEVHRGAGELYARDNKPQDAMKQLNLARERLMKLPASGERDALLIDVALIEVELVGDPAEVKKEKRLKAETVQKNLQSTLSGLGSPQAKHEALRLLSQKLLAKGQAGIPISLARNLCTGNELCEASAQLGLEMLRAKQKEPAEKQAILAEPSSETPAGDKKKKPDTSRAPPPPSLVALRLALEQPDEVAKLGPDPRQVKNLKSLPPEVPGGYVAGLAWQGKGDEALELARKMEPSLARLQALSALAAALVETGPSDAARLIPQAVELAEADAAAVLRVAANLSEADRAARKIAQSWLMLRLVRAGAQAGVAKDILQKLTSAATNPDAGLRGRAKLEMLRSQLRASKDKVDEALAEEINDSALAHGLALEAIARHNVQHGGGSVKAVDAWEPESTRPYGYNGLALGVQDK
jgi:hypothetical protein